ncbi:hypothetical protein EH223_17005 [candidate division KSB1 bacterium]|nr:hypothetical protein [candidate division KSB1 bacterium]RQW00852.1 MAG: hypothetical protein EH223_17005 [candidate division KSB1 bacterium]
MIDKKTACAMLMRVGPTYPGLLDESETSERHATAQYKCLRTAGAVGPDNNIVSPSECTFSRSCYKKV